MGITKKELIELHPNLFHMAEEGTWENIRQNGLLSTSALLDLFEINGNERVRIEEQNRRSSIKITHPSYGSVVIRDQIPMTDSALDKCLIGVSKKEWYLLINSRVFFWSNRKRLERLLGARAYRDKTQCILTVDTRSFLEEYAEMIELSPINSGSTIYNPQERGRETFLSLDAFRFAEWAEKRSRREAIVEVTVKNSVPDIERFVTRVEHVRGGEVVESIL